MYTFLACYFSLATYLTLAAVFAGLVGRVVNYFLPRPLVRYPANSLSDFCLSGLYTLIFLFCVADFAQTPGNR